MVPKTATKYIWSHQSGSGLDSSLYWMFTFGHLAWFVKWQGTEYQRKNVRIVFLCFVFTKKRDNWFFWKNETFRVFFLYFIHSPPPPVIMNIAWCSHHSMYIRIVRPWLLFSFGTFDYFLAGLGRNQAYSACSSTQKDN